MRHFLEPASYMNMALLRDRGCSALLEAVCRLMYVKRWYMICLGMCLLLSCCGRAEATGEPAAPAYLARITAGTVKGSGILYGIDEDTLFILTAAHMAEHAADAGDTVTLTFCDGWEISSSDIVISELADLAMVRVPVEDIAPGHLEAYQSVRTDKESFDLLQAGDSCLAVGFAGTEEAVQAEGYILEPWIYMEDYGQYMIWADAEIRPGMSGGGLFDGEGRFIGILSGGSEDGELAAVPLSLILQFLMSMDT